MAPGIPNDSFTKTDTEEEPWQSLQAAEKLDPIEPEASRQQPLAVVGFSLKFPQDATSTESFWKMMMEGRCAMTEIPEDRMNLNSFFSADASRRDTVGETSFLSKHSKHHQLEVY